MKLVLDLLGPPRLMGARQRFELRAGSLSVGRSPEADWTIPDTDRMISRFHLRIDASHGAFVLTDTSVNGVYVNGSDEPVGYGASVGLRDGDRLRVGEAQIAVAVEAGQPAAAGAGAPAGAPGQPFSLDAEAFAAQLVVPAARPDPFGGPFGTPGAGRSAAPAPAQAPAQATAQAAASAPSPAAPARTVIDANWMNEPLAVPGPDAPFAPRQERAPSMVLPLRPGGPSHGEDAGGEAAGEAAHGGQAARLRAVPGPADRGPSLLALVEGRPDLSARRLAAALDAAGQTLDLQAWQDLHQKIKTIVDNDRI